MKRFVYPFTAIAEQEEMKLALLLAAVDWRISVLLRGDKGAGKTTAARGLAALMPEPSPFINLPIGATEDRLLGGLHLEKTLQGNPTLKPGLLSEAHGGVLYVDEINLLPSHLGDALLDTASSGVNIVEREGLSASHPAEFVLLGSMNPEEGSLRPQLLDRFALAVNVTATLDPASRQNVVERRIGFERDPSAFQSEWIHMEHQLRDQIKEARSRHRGVTCSKEMLAQIIESVCEAGVRSLRADLAAVRGSLAYAALIGDEAVRADHVSTILPMVLAHRSHDRERPPAPRPQPPAQKPDETPSADGANVPSNNGGATMRIFAPKEIETFALHPSFDDAVRSGASPTSRMAQPGPVIAARRTETPAQLDLRATLNHAVAKTGAVQPRIEDLHEKVRRPRTGTRYVFLIDSSGSHAAQERMRLVKGATNSLLSSSFKNGDEVAIIAFRGTAAQVLLEPSRSLQEAALALEYLPTGGRTPLAHALYLAQSYITPATVLVLLTDGRANVSIGGGDPWQEALEIAGQIKVSAVVVDTERSTARMGQSIKLAEALAADCIHLEDLEWNGRAAPALFHLPIGSNP